MRGFPETRTETLETTREIKMSEKHGILIKKTEATYLDVRNRINRGDASGRAKLGIDKSIHACVILFLVASVRKFSEEEKITENTKGCYRRTLRQRKEFEEERKRGQKIYEYQKVSFVHFVCAVIDVHYKKTLPLP